MESLDLEESKAILRSSSFGILALSRDGDAYAIPLFYAYDGDAVWFHCHPGMKDDFLSETGEACLVVTHTGSEHIWESVQVFGHPEKVTLSDDLDAAKAALIEVPFPPAEGNYPGGLPVRTDHHVYHVKLKPSHIEGKKSSFKQTIRPS